MSAQRILVVDDNPITRKMVRVSLETEGYEVTEAPDATTAVALASSVVPHLILQDLVFPDACGKGLVGRLRALPAGAETVIIAFTGHDCAWFGEGGAAAAGFDDLLVKPVSPSLLIETIRAHLHREPTDAAGRCLERPLLVANDDPIQRKLQAIVFTRAGFVVETAVDGVEALEKAREHPPSAIVADVLMPRLDGFALCSAIRRDSRLSAIPLILVSSFYTDREDRELALNLGAADLVMQSPGLEDLTQAVFRALDKAEPGATVSSFGTVRDDHESRISHQLERQVAIRSDLLRQTSLQAAELSVIPVVSETLGKETGLETRLHEVLALCVDATGWSRAAIFFRCSDGSWSCPAQFDYGDEVAQGLVAQLLRLRVTQAMIENRQTVAIDACGSPSDPSLELLELLGARSALLVPILSQDTLIGILLADSTLPGISAQSWLPVALATASQIAQAITLTEALKQVTRSERRCRVLLEHSSDVIVLLDGEAAIRYTSQSAVGLLGYDPNTDVGASLYRLIHHDDLPMFRQNFGTVLERPGASVAFVFCVCHRDGSLRCVEAVAVNRLQDETIGSVVMNLRDITERRRRERIQRVGDERFRQLADHIQEVFFILETTTGKTIYVSPAYESTFGMSVQSAYATPGAWLKAIHPEDRERINASVIAGRAKVEVFRVVHPDGSLRWIRGRGFPVQGTLGASDRVVGIAEDITELHATEEALRQSQKLEAVGRLAGGIAHDFNNLLTAILGYSEMVMAELQPGDPLQHAVAEIKHAGSRAANLTHQLLAFSRRQVLDARVVDVNEQVHDLESMLRRLLREDIRLDIRLATGPLHLMADPTQLDQIILNLAINSRDAMAHGGQLTIATQCVTLPSPRIHDQVEIPAGEYAVITVADNGIGMDDSTRARIFEPFFTTKEVGRGTGLGLATVYGIVQQSGGHICVATAPGNGTTFTIYLPLVDSPAEAGPRLADAEIRQGSETVLLVEDEDAVRRLAAKGLERLGYRVLVASNGGEALQMLEQRVEPIDLLVTDVIMPGVCGPELAQQLRLRRPDLQVLYVSGYNEILASRGIEPGAALLAKPFTPDSLSRKVRELLDRPVRTEEHEGSDTRFARAA